MRIIVSLGVLFVGALSLPHDAEKRRLVEQSCVEFERDLRAFLNGVLRDVHQVDDAFQKTVVLAMEASSQVIEETVRGWLFRIALNVARELKRGQSRQNRLHKAVWESSTATAQRDPSDGLQQSESKEDQESVRRALARLDAKYRDVVFRRIQKGQSFAEIAQDLDRPLGTVLTWMRRALAALREMEELRQFSDDER